MDAKPYFRLFDRLHLDKTWTFSEPSYPHACSACQQFLPEVFRCNTYKLQKRRLL